MPYPRPDDSILEQWSSVVDVLRQGSHADHGLMRAAYPTSFEILVASPDDSPVLRPGERDSRDDTHLCDEVIRSREPLCVADVTEDARWDATVERRSGFRSYCGAPLLWPDEEAFGTLAMVRSSPLEESEELNARQLVDCLAMGINAQLTLLYRNHESEFRGDPRQPDGARERSALFAPRARDDERAARLQSGTVDAYLEHRRLRSLAPGYR